MHYGWPSPSIPKLTMEDLITDDEGSWMAVMPLLGAIMGSMMVGATVDILGRKRTILISSLPYFATWIMVACSRSVAVLYAARFLAGIADGWVFTAVPMYIGEIAEARIRGLLGTLVPTAFIAGILAINVIGSYLSITMAAFVSSIIPILTLLTFCWMPESPYYLLMRSNPIQAKKSLQTFRGTQDVEVEVARLTAAVKSQMSNSGRFIDLFVVKTNRKPLLIMVLLRAAQQLSGSAAITFYTQSIFMESGADISKEAASITFFAVQMVMSLICSALVDKCGRRPLLIISLSGSAISLFAEATYFYIDQNTVIDTSSFTFVPVAALILFVIMFTIGMQAIPLVMLGELFATNIKAFGLCFADIYFAVLATLVSKFFQIMRDSVGIYVPFYTFAVSCVIGLVLICIFVPETKGKTLEEIQIYFSGEEKSDVMDNKCSDEQI
ncbi:unnamed protein product [Acanthoscelides obtectus]|uniref:Major facilitator superfamily (MFS) profile domain-containing protein n=1 Tax=Acanthoscelides obtectus TaxID=200917 RepID=A0A9P0P4F9_ACAOB|nr:unnamed protein product [Acanthoscelides obtectus]CAK1655471.1 Facilitated trehalose transporter Tret1 [Acanthoscelides obtectus]